MELDSEGGMAVMPDRHHEGRVGVGPRIDDESWRKRDLVHHERMVASDAKRPGKSGEEAFSRMHDRGRLAVDRRFDTAEERAEPHRERLVAETHSEDRHAAESTLDELAGYARVCGIPGPGEMTRCVNRRRRISPTGLSSLRTTSTREPQLSSRCARFQVKES